MRILLLDDEKPQLDGLYHIVNKHYPSFEILCASNSEKALQMLKECPVDIIITDIQMPIISGLDLIENLHSINVYSKIIIVSAYDKFSYAQRAISLGVMSYILKPFEEKQIISSIDKIIEVLNEDYSKVPEAGAYNIQASNAMPVYIEYILNKLATSILTESEDSFLPTIVDYNSPSMTFLSRFDCIIDETIKHDYSLSIQNALGDLCKAESFVYHKSPIDLCTILQLSSDLDTAASIITERITKGAFKNYNINYSISGVFKKFPLNFSEVLNKLIYFCDYNWFFPHSANLGFNQMPQPPLSYFSIPSNIKESLLCSIRLGKTDEAINLVHKAFKMNNENSIPSREMFISEINSLMNNSAKLLLELNADNENIKLAESLGNCLLTSVSIESALAMCKEYISQIIKRRNSITSLNSRNIMEDCMKYIDEHYIDDLSLENTAERYHFNPSYFSTLFSACTDSNFSEYLTRIRMEKSALQLVSTSKKVYEIASSVGYSDSGYFNRVFKRKYGISPDKYRKLYSK